MLNNGTAGTSTAAEPTFADEIGAMFGDAPSGESPATDDTDDAGSPPASTADETPDNAQASSEGSSDDELAGSPPAAAAAAAPDNAQAVDEDPLAGSEPGTYTVNGQTRTFDGLTKLGDKGGIISAEAYPKLIQRLSAHDNLFERQRETYQRQVALENQLNQLTQWNVKDANGQQRTLTGVDAMEERNVLLARSLATERVLMQALDDPDTFASLVTVVQDRDGNARIVLDPSARRTLSTMVENAALKMEQQVRGAMGKLRSSFASTSPTSSSSSTSPSGSVSTEVATQTVDNFAADMQVTNLTADDKKLLAASLPRYVRAATPEERAQLGPDTRVVVDASFRDLVQHTSQLRTEAAKSVKASANAATENARRLAAAAAGQRKPGSNVPAKGKTPAASSPSQKAPRSNAAKAWDLMENLASGKLGTANDL